ncbi:MAG: hypothetical protein IPN70_00390 [Candidatus Moraniibacteriota bacterium]|nr:MAG: hypothetical protein IPN70_00390 [Candidatus Moranbacteria bacterium]
MKEINFFRPSILENLLKTKRLEENDVEKILTQEDSYFERDLSAQNSDEFSVEADSFFFLTSVHAGEEYKNPQNLPIKVYRSKEWVSGNEKDRNMKHLVTYYTNEQDLYKEYLPEDLHTYLYEEIYSTMKEEYPLCKEEENTQELFFKIQRKEASQEDIARYKEYERQSEIFIQRFRKFKKAAILAHPEIEKKIIAFQNPLIFRGYNYNNSDVFRREGIQDIRYISKEEIDEMKKKGYDGFAFEQYGWFVKFEK